MSGVELVSWDLTYCCISLEDVDDNSVAVGDRGQCGTGYLSLAGSLGVRPTNQSCWPRTCGLLRDKGPAALSLAADRASGCAPDGQGLPEKRGSLPLHTQPERKGGGDGPSAPSVLLIICSDLGPLRSLASLLCGFKF